MIKSKAQWWQTVDRKWGELYPILVQLLPLDGYEDYQGNLRGEMLSKIVGELKVTHNAELARYFRWAYLAAPDEPWVKKLPGWSTLGELCEGDGELFCDEEEREKFKKQVQAK